MIRTKAISLVIALAGFGLTVPAEAQGLSLSYGKRTKHGSFSINVGNPGGYGYGGRFAKRSYGNRGYDASCSIPRKRWIPGHYQEVPRQVWVQGRRSKVWVPARFETFVDDCGQVREVLVEEGRWEVRHEPGYYETRYVKVWVPGRWSYRR